MVSAACFCAAVPLPPTSASPSIIFVSPANEPPNKLAAPTLPPTSSACAFIAGPNAFKSSWYLAETSS